ncbi:MAG: PH domain-containing protein [Pseudoxanthomonas sp.]
MLANDEGAINQERRLHPWSWLFVLVQHLKQFILPLLVLLVFGGRGDRSEFWTSVAPLAAVGVLAVVSLLEYFTYRYRIGTDKLTVRSGWLQRSVREIPFARIHNVAVHQSLLHRLFGVAEVRLESAGGHKPEAQMRVLRLDQALALEEQVRQRGRDGTTTHDATTGETIAVPQRDVLLALPPAEIVRLGLISNRGMIVFAAAFGMAWQVFPERLITDFFKSYARQLFGYADHLHLGWAQMALASLALVALGLVLLRVLSVVLAFVQYHGFTLSEAQRRLTVERGLLTRLRTSVARRRIQAFTLHEGLLHRLFKRRSLQVDTAAARQQGQEQDRTLKELAPIATADTCDALVRHVLPQAHWPPPQWQPLQGSTWRLFWPGALFFAAVALATTSFTRSAWGLLPLLWLPWGAYSAWQQARRLSYAADDTLVAVRGGWWSRWWRFAEIDKLQALRLSRSPIDRRCGTATLWLDTAGAGGLETPLRIRFLPESEAQALLNELGAKLARRRLRW